jgi:hypothetical protein
MPIIGAVIPPMASPICPVSVKSKQDQLCVKSIGANIINKMPIIIKNSIVLFIFVRELIFYIQKLSLGEERKGTQTTQTAQMRAN